MDVKQIISLKPENITDENREEISNFILDFRNQEKVDKNAFKKLFRIAQFMLKYKGEQVTSLSSEIDILTQRVSTIDEASSSTTDIRSITSENNKLRKLVEKLESEKSQQRIKLKQLNEEIQVLQRKPQSQQFTSDREDSPDALSDLDQQKELLNNISLKNKHIKRLLREVENLETKNGEQEKEVLELRSQLKEAIGNLESLNNQFKDSQNVIKDQINVIEALNVKIKNTDELVLEMQKEVDDRETEIYNFGKELEKRANLWKGLLDQKQNELESLKVKYEDIMERHPGYNIDAERADLKRLTISIKERDCLIKDLEDKLFEMSNELITATDVINKLLVKENESKDTSKREKTSDCCEENRQKLSEAKRKIQELNELIINLEEDNVLKSKQALEAIESLNNYESGQDGLPQALEKIISLEQKLKYRDKQIKDLVKEINQCQDLAKENIALRQQLGMPEDETVPTTFIEAKQKKLEKINERLTLKLRASEESRLKLKLDKNELKRQLKGREPSSDFPIEAEKKTNTPIQPESSKHDHFKEKDILEDLQKKYEIVVEENENLRIGMHEILHKLRDYDATSNRISIDTDILEKVLHALDARSVSGWYHPAMRMQNELIVSKERELALKEQLRTNENILKSVKKLSLEDIPGIENYTQTDLDIDSVHFGSMFEHLNEKILEIQELKLDLNKIKESDHEKSLEIEELKNYKNLYNEFCINVSEDDLKEKLSQLRDLSTENIVLQRKNEYLSEENSLMIRQFKEMDIKHKELYFNLKSEFLNKTVPGSNGKNYPKYNYNNLSEEVIISLITREHGRFCKEFLDKIKTDDFLKIIDKDNKLGKISVIDEELQTTEFITKDEFITLNHKLNVLQIELDGFKIERESLEKSLELYKTQLEEQQALINRSSDVEISLRHLVVDLQSEGTEKQLLARSYRELSLAQESQRCLKEENEKLIQQLKDLQSKIQELNLEVENQSEAIKFEEKNNAILIRYLKKSLLMMQQNYSKYTPQIFLKDFLKIYKNVQEENRKLSQSSNGFDTKTILDEVLSKLKNTTELNKNEEKINLVKYKTNCELLQSKLDESNERINVLQKELSDLRTEYFNFNQHWTTLNLLLGEETTQKTIETQDKFIQTEVIDKISIGINTIPIETSIIETIKQPIIQIEETILTKSAPETEIMASHKSLESQLKQAMILASTRSALLLETENRLAESQGRIKAMERSIEEKEKLLKEKLEQSPEIQDEKKDDNILSITIASLQNLLLEKDTTLSRYQELLKTERNEHSKSCNEYQNEIEKYKTQIEELNRKIRDKEQSIDDLKTKAKERSEKHDDTKSEVTDKEIEEESNKFIDDIFLNESKVFELEEKIVEIQNLELKLQEYEDEIQKLQHQLREVSNRESMWERNLTEKDNEIRMLNEKLKAEFKNVDESITNCRDIEQLKEMLEEKDRHINDLTETLTHFHDDQQKYISDTTLHSAEQMSQLTADLNRSEATNKVLNTQLEALKRQITNLGHREKQARDLVKTLKNQLIRRPVISIKNQKATSKEEQFQRRIELLQNELIETKEELRKQTHLAETRKIKSSQELNLWEKQKRAQQNADKLKLRLSERETELEKLKMNLNSARQTISRLEREKNIIESRIQRNFCHSASCPNERSTSESPESDEHEYYGNISVTAIPKHLNDANNEILKALQSRVETQQRKIVAMELEGKGTNVLTHEMQKLQEKISGLEAQNLRLEAKNLQLQLDNDLKRQGDENERQKRQIKHLEDYILLLKSELSEALAQNSKVSDSQSSKVSSATNMEQTILALKRIVERLRVENKNLKEGKTTINYSTKASVPKEVYEKLLNEHSKLKDLYSEALNKISTNEICKNCKLDSNRSSDLKITLEKLDQKSKLLEKAKVLLTRAAAKEKNLREQIEFWKRKCAELQNVPVIEEASE